MATASSGMGRDLHLSRQQYNSPVFTVEFDPSWSFDAQLLLPSNIAVIGIEVWVENLASLAS